MRQERYRDAHGCPRLAGDIGASPPVLAKGVLPAAWDVLGTRFPDFERFSSIFANTGIIKRHGVKPFDWYLEPRGWPERTAAFLEGAEALFVDVAGKALADAHLTGADIDTVVTVCSTGIATPSLEARVARRMGFRSDVTRVPVFGLGCAGGTSGLSIASRLAQARPGTNVLLVTIELCSLALRHDQLTKANIIAVSLFGDGAAAVVLRAGDGGMTRIEHTGEHLWPDTLDIMGWSVDPEGFGVIFRRTIPEFIIANLIRPSRRFSRACGSALPTSTASSAIPAAPKWSARWKPRLRSIRDRSTANARFSPTTAICRHPRCCSCSNRPERRACRHVRC